MEAANGDTGRDLGSDTDVVPDLGDSALRAADSGGTTGVAASRPNRTGSKRGWGHLKPSATTGGVPPRRHSASSNSSVLRSGRDGPAGTAARSAAAHHRFQERQEMRAQCPPGLAMGRDRLMACTTAEGQLPHGPAARSDAHAARKQLLEHAGADRERRWRHSSARCNRTPST